MNRSILLLTFIFLTLPYIVHSVATFVIQETERISLAPNATDPDADDLTSIYEFPLNENGEWQTAYGDSGEYKTKITVSDGFNRVSEDVLIVVEKKEEKPAIVQYAPTQDMLQVKETGLIEFSATAEDLNKDKLRYSWLLDSKETGSGQNYTYETEYGDAGTHEIILIVSDGTSTATIKWSVEVEKVDVEDLLDKIKDVTLNENEIARLDLPDFEKYGLAYRISEPLGNNEWQTTYNDSGIYRVEVQAYGKGFSGDKTVTVTVNNADRAPVFEPVGNKIVNENQTLTITLEASDLDDDSITHSATNMPAGALLEGNVFTWVPDYDTVKNEDFVDWVLEKFRVLSKSFYIQFVVSSNDKEIVQNIIVTVRDVNRAPVIEDIDPININEGESLKLSPKSYDLDGDKVSLKYSGFISSDSYTSDFDDAGDYSIEVIASDGQLETSKFAKVNISNVNRVPVFEKMEPVKANEGDSIAVLLNANDPDGDEINFSIDNPPDGSSFKGNSFFWTPAYNVTNKGEARNFDLVFAASDGQVETSQIVQLQISDKNRAPKIVNASRNIVAGVNEPVLMFVKAIDEDNDDLTYTWDFGLLEKYKATSTHQRIFTSTGTKTVKVIVSDGINEVEQIINANVVPQINK